MAKKRRTNPRKIVASKADVEKAKRYAERNTMIMMMAVPLMAMHDVYGFGPKRLNRLADRMLKLFNDWDTGEFTAEEANDWLWEYAGIKIGDKV